MLDFKKGRKTEKKYRISFLCLKRHKVTIHFPKISVENDLNIFQQLSPKEPQHSKILGSLLNPKFDYGDVFLKLFFEVVLNDPEFITESTDKWIITTEKERYDIRIRNQINSKIIIIENKSNNAEDQGNQLYRYWLNGIYLPQYRISNTPNIPTYKRILYLSPDESKKPSEQTKSRPGDFDGTSPDSVPLGIIKIVYFHKEIINWLDACMKAVEEKSDIYFYLKQYKDYWRT
jgi:hypothetical protein